MLLCYCEIEYEFMKYIDVFMLTIYVCMYPMHVCMYVECSYLSCGTRASVSGLIYTPWIEIWSADYAALVANFIISEFRNVFEFRNFLLWW